MWDSIETEDNDILDDQEEQHVVLLDETPRRRKRKQKDDKDTNEYVSKEEMWDELYNYYLSMGDNYDWENQKPIRKDVFPSISDKLTNIINDIAVKMGNRANFCGYSWLEEMIGDARFKMIKAVRDCSFKCYTISPVISKTIEANQEIIDYLDKKGTQQYKVRDSSDFFFIEDGVEYIKFKANPFGYFSRITSHSFLNRMKKENIIEETKRAFQAKTWDELYANENFRNVRRTKFIDSDENDAMFDE